MAKSELEKQIERQMRQEKQLADRKRREDEKQIREQKRMEREAAIRQRASSIVNGQPFIEGFRIMDETAEIVLNCLLNCEGRKGNHIDYTNLIFPEYIKFSVDLELEKLVQYGVIGNLFNWDAGGMLDLLPPALSYFQKKEEALDLQKKHEEDKEKQSITNYGNLVFGNVSGSTLTVDNSIHEIEKAIEEKGGEDKAELYELLDEVKELIENIENSRSVPKQKKLFQKISNHLAKHSWFYGAVVQLLGNAIIGLLGV